MQEVLTNKTIERLKYDLVRENLVSYEDLTAAEEIALAQKINIGQALIISNIISEDKLLRFMESKLHIPYVNLDDYSLDERCLQFISLQDAEKYKVVPLFKIEDVLTVAMADPLDLFAINNILENLEYKIEPIICSEANVIRKINEYYKKDIIMEEITSAEIEEKFDWQNELRDENYDESSAHSIIKAILKQAVIENIHEILFEHSPYGLDVRFKSGGQYVEKGNIPVLLIPLFISKLKRLSNLDPSVSELPQLGKLNFKMDDTNLVTSISAFPTIQGERIALKIYKPPEKLENLKIDAVKINHLKKCLEKPGIILVCGSGLCGKTSIIYSMLLSAAENKKSIMTIESITKYDLPKVNQCELNENIGFNLDKAMRFIEFQSPEAIYFEGINTRSALEFFTSLALKDKLVLTELLAHNIEDLRQKFSYPEFSIFKSMISCLVFIHNKESIEIFDKKELERYI